MDFSFFFTNFFINSSFSNFKVLAISYNSLYYFCNFSVSVSFYSSLVILALVIHSLIIFLLASLVLTILTLAIHSLIIFILAILIFTILTLVNLTSILIFFPCDRYIFFRFLLNLIQATKVNFNQLNINN